jgi:hypothetical protein
MERFITCALEVVQTSWRPIQVVEHVGDAHPVALFTPAVS